MTKDRIIEIGLQPFMFPASILDGSIKKAGLGAGALVLIGIIANVAYFGIAFAISKKYPGKEVLKKALIAWAIMVVVTVIYLKKKEDDRPKPPVTLNS